MTIVIVLLVLVVATMLVTFVAYSTVQAMRRRDARTTPTKHKGVTKARGYGIDPSDVHRRP
jgi:hypothetical protein